MPGARAVGPNVWSGGAASVNWGHPLAAGLKLLDVWSGQSLVPVDVTGPRAITYSGTPSASVMAVAPSGRASAVGDLWIVAPSSLVPTDKATVLVIRRKNDTTNRDSALFGTDAGTDPSGFCRCGAHVPWSDGTVYFDFGGFGSGSSRISVGGLSMVGTQYWGFVAGSRGMSIWLNGIQQASHSSAITRSANPDGNFDINRGNGNAGGDLQDVCFFALLNAEWGSSEMRQWYANPFAFLTMGQRRNRPASGRHMNVLTQGSTPSSSF